jgi:diguanylate cyclase (GGDEF)-like protein
MEAPRYLLPVARSAAAAAEDLAGLDVTTLHALADHLDELLWIRSPAGRLSFVSEQSLAVLGQTPLRLLTDPELWPGMVPAEWRNRLAWLDPPAGLEHESRCEYPLRTAHGERWVQECCFPVRGDDGRLRHVIGATRDVTHQHRAVQAMRLRLERAHDRALRDPLTGLLNRQGLERAASALAVAESGGQETAVLLIDCDDFKRINDLHGHDTGDAVLREISARAQRHLRPTDTLGRLGGDEFLSILPQTRLGEAVRIGERVKAAFENTPVVVGGRSLRVTISIGAGTLPPNSPTIAAALAAADASLLAGKRIGKNCVVAGHRELQPFAGRRLDPARVRILAQPICRIDDLAIVGYETCSRGLLGSESTGILFALSSPRGSMLQLDWTCLEASVAAAQALPPGPAGPVPLHVNIRPETAIEVPLERWAAVRERLRGGLVLEIAEQLLVGTPLALRERIAALRSHGIRIALDGLGCGRGSLEALLVLEPDLVKIDRRLVQGADRDRGRARTLARMLAVASGLDIGMIPVGIETEAERAMLANLGYELGQGFLFGRPEPVRRPTRQTTVPQ